MAPSPGSAAAIRRVHGARGTAWIDALPTVVERCAARWSLRLDAHALSAGGLVAHARSRTGAALTLKLVIDPRAFASERSALLAFGGHATVTLIDAFADARALLLERVTPGERLGTLVGQGRDEEATRAAADVIRAMHATAAPPPAGLDDIGREAAAAFDAYLHRHRTSGGPIPPSRIARAAERVRELSGSRHDVVTLHGDLHHDNILSARRAPWLAIDPKGRTGDAASEVAALIRNPLDHLSRVADLRAYLARRVDQLVALLAYDRARVIGWAVALAHVAACWEIEDGGAEWRPWLLVADALE